MPRRYLRVDSRRFQFVPTANMSIKMSAAHLEFPISFISGALRGVFLFTLWVPPIHITLPVSCCTRNDAAVAVLLDRTLNLIQIAVAGNGNIIPAAAFLPENLIARKALVEEGGEFSTPI